MTDFYTYAWLREDKTPYYIGKGKGNRAWRKGSPDGSRVLILKKDLTEAEAFKHEIYMIAVFGRKDIGTGILHNFTDGGEGMSGYKFSEGQKLKLSELRRGENNHTYGKPRSEGCKRKISKRLSGRTLSDDIKQKMSESRSGSLNHQFGKPAPNRGKKTSDEVKKKMSEAAQRHGRQQVVCPHCGKSGSIRGMGRWHFANCKSCHTT